MGTAAEGKRNRARTFEAVVAHIAEHGWAPSYSEIMAATGIASKSTVMYHLVALEQDGKLRLGRESRSAGARMIALVPDPRQEQAAKR